MIIEAQEEKSLDQWIDDTLAVVNNCIYTISFNINHVLREVLSSVR